MLPVARREGFETAVEQELPSHQGVEFPLFSLDPGWLQEQKQWLTQFTGEKQQVAKSHLHKNNYSYLQELQRAFTCSQLTCAALFNSYVFVLENTGTETLDELLLNT